MSKHLTLDFKKEIVKYYKTKPMTYEDLSNHFNLSLPTIGKILKEFKIKPYTKVQLFSPDLKEDYFNIIDSEEKAYFLGLIITDGCIYKKNSKQNLVSITLQEKDRYLIEKFKKAINSNKKVTSDGRGCYGLNILSNIMVKDLEKYGIKENKSLTTIFPKNIDKQWYPALIRGILDGDGSISFYSRPNRKSHVKAIRFCQGNEEFLRDLIKCLEDNAQVIPVHLYQEKENLWSIAYRKNDSMVKLINYIYNNANIYMIRKKELCDKIMTEIQSYGNTEITN